MFGAGDGSQIIKLRGLPFSTTVDDVLQFLSGISVVNGKDGVHLTEVRPGRPSGECFVEVETQEDVEEALKKDKENMGKRYIEVFSTDRQDMEWALNAMRQSENGFESIPNVSDDYGIVKLRGLPFGCSKEEIELFFDGLTVAQDGVHLLSDHTGRASGEAFVYFVDKQSAQDALGRDREKIGHRYIEVFISSPDEVRAYSSRMEGGAFKSARGYRPTPYDRNDRFSGGRFGGRGGRGGSFGRDFETSEYRRDSLSISPVDTPDSTQEGGPDQNDILDESSFLEETASSDLDPDIIAALGDSTSDAPNYGENIHDHLSKLWLDLLKKGIQKEIKDKLLMDYVAPDNCRLLQAPKLNAEISAAVPDPVRYRDKSLSISQQQLGSGITAISRGMQMLLKDENKVNALKHFSNACRLLCDAHHSATQTRIKLLTPHLDNLTLKIINESERDETLFGKTLSEKMKAANAIEKQRRSVKKLTLSQKSTAQTSRTSRTTSSYQGNWQARPRYQRSTSLTHEPYSGCREALRESFTGKGGGAGYGGGRAGGGRHDSCHCVHMRGLPFKASPQDIAYFFKPIRPMNINILYDNSGRPSGEADVEFECHEDAMRAMRRDKNNMEHRYIELFMNSSPGGGGPAGGNFKNRTFRNY
ncbi:uncharacterized protein LOC112050538 isoform X1 [Bicyclus anynana]|uniref:Uncharacterized protein LOC112050538 isoform X1 n=1 Tax=Bicyclus anynana TaxID=110368 RepID=A0A6J1NI34_BICAN|nr:uncharacterized protein LOC112050538 isoform X1 [Bicyclus anynana]